MMSQTDLHLVSIMATMFARATMIARATMTVLVIAYSARTVEKRRPLRAAMTAGSHALH